MPRAGSSGTKRKARKLMETEGITYTEALRRILKGRKLPKE
jgi:hypothetical protein